MGKSDWPRYTEEEPETYEPAELEKLFKACDAEERLWYEFFLMTVWCGRRASAADLGWFEAPLPGAPRISLG